jgi:CheY-like chemotaxis protein
MDTPDKNQKAKKILVIEDHQDMQAILKLRLENMGFSVIQAMNGEEGVKKTLEDKPDLILMDLMMPVQDGWEATRILRPNMDTQHIPILVVTTQRERVNEHSSIDAGFDDYLIKPYTPA